jgi:hypothetical protein
MDRCIKLALVGVITVSLAGFSFINSFAYRLYFGQVPTTKLSVAVTGWALASYGPVIVAALIWKLAKRSSVPWLFHILLLPSFYALLVAGNALMLSTLNVPDFDDTLGAPIMLALFIIIGTMAIYLLALIVNQTSRFTARGNGS